MATYRVTVPAGPIMSNDDAKIKGPIVAAAHLGKFTGVWASVIWGKMSVVEIELNDPQGGSSSYTMDVLAGPIWDNDDAKIKCPVVCASYGGTWDGQWATVVDGNMSVCGCTFKS
jgi:hypothetical protein